MHLNVVYTTPTNNTQCFSPECNARWTGALGGWREKEGYREAGGRKERECLQGLCALFSVTVPHAAESLKTERGTFGLHGPFGNLRDFTHRSRFLAFLEKSSVLAIPSQHFYMGRQLAGK